MAKPPANQRKQWTKRELAELQDLASRNTPTRPIALKLGRSPNAVRSKASEDGVSLKPTNQSPYNRRKKERRQGKGRHKAGPIRWVLFALPAATTTEEPPCLVAVRRGVHELPGPPVAVHGAVETVGISH